jgi:hypothetical protein
MTFKPAIWYPIAAVLSVLNLVAVGFAAAPAEPWHATAHAGLSLGFGLWAQRLRRSRGGEDRQVRLELLEDEMDRLRAELSEAQERLDFTERLLAQGQESRRVGPER